MFSTKYCSIFSWNSGSMKVASARDLVKETIKCQPWWWMMFFSWWFFHDGDFFMVMMQHLISGSDTRRGSMAGTWGIRPLSRVRDIVKNRVHGQTWVIVIIAMSPPSKSSPSTRIGQQVTTNTVLKMINRSILDSLPSHSSSIKSQWIHQAFRQKWFHCWFCFLVFG